MRKNLTQKRIPVFLALIVLTAVIAITIILVRQGVFIVSKATPDKGIENFAITNITDTSFTVVFTTNQETSAVVSLNDNNTGEIIILDDRDKPRGEENSYFSHHITVPNLNPETQYKFSIISGGETFINEKNFYTVTTATTINSNPPDQNPLFGSVLLSTGKAGSDVLVTAQISGSQVVSSVTKDNGKFIIPTNSLRVVTLGAYFIIDNNPKVTINAIRQNMKAFVTATFKQALSLPPIVLSENYDFTDQSVEQLATFSSQLEIPIPTLGNRKITISIPENQQSFIDDRPLFRGTAFPSTLVTVAIPDQNIRSETTSNLGGVWTFRPKAGFGVGQHTIIVESKDNIGRATRISREFIVLASGSQIAQSATPSATPTTAITNTPTPTIEPTTTITPSPTQDLGITPTVTLSPSPSASITATTTLIPTSTPLPSIEAPGSFAATLALTGFSIIFIIAGAALLFAL